MSKVAKTRSRIISVYHGCKHWSPSAPIRARAINYMLLNGKNLDEAVNYANGLLVLLFDLSNRTLLSDAMLQAQRSGLFSPFVSTSRRREVALSFALYKGTPGFILTIEGPEDKFYDFEKIRADNKLPQPSEYEWMEEMGIPLGIDPPFEVVSVDYVTGIIEKNVNVFHK